MKTLFCLWVGVCCLAWTLSDVGAEKTISETKQQLVHRAADNYIESLGELESWGAAAIQRMLRVRETNSICDSSDKFGSCKCRNQNCGCCVSVNLPTISLVGGCCVNVSYLTEEIGLKVTFSFDDRILFEHKVSVQNPPPLCFGIPGIARAVGICIGFYNLRRKDNALCGCIKIGFSLARVQVFSLKIGCFGIPIGDGEKAERRADLIVRSFNLDAGQRDSEWKDIHA